MELTFGETFSAARSTELGDGGWRGDPPSHPSSGRARQQMAPGAAGGLAGDEGQTGERDTAGLNL